MKSILTAAAAFALSVSQSFATDFVAGIGYTDFGSNRPENQPVLSFEVHSNSFASFAGFEVGALGVISVHEGGDYYLGAGLSGVRDLGNRWFLEASLAPGLYFPDNTATDLGSTFEFRSLIGLGRHLRNGTAISLAVTHKSNAGTAGFNPGVDTVQLRWRQEF